MLRECFSLAIGLVGLAACAVNLPPATHDSVHYGPHERQVVDVWFPEGASGPVPVVVNIHGGGFTHGERKEHALEKWIPESLAAGVAVVSVEYRLVQQAGDTRPPVRICMDDIREAVRFVRSKAADWNLDLDRFALSGGSAGGCAALYVALSGDNEFGVKAVYADAPQTTLDPKVMREWIPNSCYGHRLFGFDDFQAWYDKREDCRKWIQEYSAMSLLETCRADKIPAVIYNGPAAPPPGQLPKDPTHNGTFTQRFESAARARGADCRRGTFADALDAIRHPTAPGEPPAILAVPGYNRKTGEFRMDYNGHTLLQFVLPPDTPLVHRSSGAGILTTPLTEQFTFAVRDGKPVVAKMRWTLSPESYCMRPRRARGDEAILGQVGVPLVFGVNGLYSLDEDLLVYWTDRNWRWTDAELRRDALGRLTAEMEVTLTDVPWVVNMRVRYYKEHLGYSHYSPWARKPKTEPVAGWCSWLAHHKNIDEGKILDATKFLSEKFAPYGLTHLQIDDGFQDPKMGITPGRSHAESWLDPTKSFPHGVTNTVRAIRAAGLHPAVWMNTDIKAYERKKGDRDIIFRNRDGSPLRMPVFSSLFVSQGTDEALEDTFAPLWRAFAGAGFEYIKIDGVRHTFYDGFGAAVRAGLISTEEARRRMRRLWETARECAGDNTFLLSCWGMQSESVGMVDGCRISTDTDTSWEKLFLQQYELARYWPLQRILFQLDPDHICARAERPWAVATLSTVSLCGGLFMVSDPVDAYSDSLAYDIQRALPPLPTRPAETAPIDLSEPAYANHRASYKADPKNPLNETNSGVFENREGASPFGTLWAHHFAKDGRKWAVVHRTALFSLPATKISLKNLGLDPAKRYTALDFWCGRFMGTVNGILDIPALAAGNSQTVIMREEAGRPAFLASSRHVGGGYVELEKEEWNAKEGVLNLTFAPQPEAVTAYIHSPDAFRPQNGAAAQGGIVTMKVPASDRRQVVAVRFDCPQEAYLFAYFSSNGYGGRSGQAAGMRLAYSYDGLTWTALCGERPFVVPNVGQGLMRDPSITQGPDGIYHLVWTTSWNARSIGHATSKDLIDWSEQELIPVMEHESGAKNTWAPEVTYNPDDGLFYIYWATTIPGRCSGDGVNEKGWNHRIYLTTTKDWKEFTPARLWFNPTFSAIDAALLRVQGGEKKWMMAVKNENEKTDAGGREEKNIRLVWTDDLSMPLPSEVGTPITYNWVEGPSPLRVGNSIYVYFDCYTKNRYGAVRSDDNGRTWCDVSNAVSFPRGVRHGTAFPVSPVTIENIRARLGD